MIDIGIKTEEGKFKFRVCGIVKSGDKMLIQKIQGNNFYCLAGGHVELGEDTLTAIKREMLEEVGIHTKNEKLISVMENFFENGERVFHELGFYYEVEAEEKLDTNDYSVEENDKGEMKHLDYKWVTKEQLKDIDFRPVVIKDLMVNGSKQLEHIVFKG
mgnify:CR=1 FL=1